MPPKPPRLLAAPLTIQLSHLALSVIWNLTGIYLIHQGQTPLGPTASFTTIIILIVNAMLMLVGAKKSSHLYVVVTIVAMLGASLAIAGAFSKDPSLWPNEFWRFTGVVLNSLALIGGLFGFFRLYTTRIK